MPATHAETITTATYRNARKSILIACLSYARWARSEPSKREHFQSWRKEQQRHLARIRAATKRPAFLYGAF